EETGHRRGISGDFGEVCPAPHSPPNSRLPRQLRSCIVPTMAKLKPRYVCQACGSVSHRWQGQCTDCADWNTLIQESAEVSSIFAAKHNLQGGGRMIPLVGLDHPSALPERLPS